MKICSNTAGDLNDENNFTLKLLLTNTQVQLHKIKQSGGFLGTLLIPLLKTGLI